MRAWVYFVILIIFVNVVTLYFHISGPVFFGVFVPVYVIGATYLSTLYNTRASLKPEPVPAGYAGRAKELDKEVPTFAGLGFRRVDSYYLKSVPDSITYVLRHTAEPVYLYLSHFGQKKAHFFTSYFSNDVSLTTSRLTSAGMVKRPPKRLIQIFPKLSYGDLLAEHRKTQEYLVSKGLKLIEIPLGIRAHAEKGHKEFSTYVRSISLWPAKLVYWTVTSRGRVHAKPVEEQIKTGIVPLVGKGGILNT